MLTVFRNDIERASLRDSVTDLGQGGYVRDVNVEWDILSQAAPPPLEIGFDHAELCAQGNQRRLLNLDCVTNGLIFFTWNI